MAIKFGPIGKVAAPAVRVLKATRKSRAPYLNGKTKEAEKPWVALGMSRRTWYRRQKGKA